MIQIESMISSLESEDVQLLTEIDKLVTTTSQDHQSHFLAKSEYCDTMTNQVIHYIHTLHDLINQRRANT